MSKHTVFVEAPPFAKFSDAEMRRLLEAMAEAEPVR